MTKEPILKSNNHHQREEINVNIHHGFICKEKNSNFDLNESEKSRRQRERQREDQDVKCFELSVVSEPCERKSIRRMDCIRLRKKSILSSSLPCLL
jgi:hypothetical protein